MFGHPMLDLRMKLLRSRFAEKGMSLTHQRWVIYRTLADTDEHLTPEETFARVRSEIPSVSLATIYKNIRTFLDIGLLKEVSTPDQRMRLDANLDPHHHLICVHCGVILDLPEDSVAPVSINKALPGGFKVDGYHLSFLGVCAQCKPLHRVSS